ncbi:IF-2B-domain-containing protein [Xylona heveae TC161]|uniref:Translation initiation factor eIF2B subunit delta n=1 Tax=Xylona heveae (strain CBS 132557 / TC161) TaxID=1328760 RepID=A0A165JUJ1_XYLHT|nr:IF-2B-domain-containing protein [Xylona heveae TC161]KZF26646.1 IF-2B-domain-containing protein [Xylona heveae TC161]
MADTNPQNPTAGAELSPAPAKDQKSPKADTKQAQPKPNGTEVTATGPNGEKLSGAELKKRAKAEKAARREREKADRQGPGGGVPHSGGQDKAGNQKPGKPWQKVEVQQHKDDSVAGSKGHHKRTTSTAAADHQKNLALRGKGAQGGAQAAAKPPKDANQVSLFGHLYGQSRRTTLAGVGKDVHPAVLALGLQMSNYVICGSNARCIATLLALKRVIESYTTPPGHSLSRHLTSHHLSPQIDYLVSCRPMSVSMGNAIRWLKLEISKVDPDTPENEAKEDLCDSIDNFIRERITVADQVIATSAGGKIQNGDVVLTYAKSSIVQQTLIEAHKRGVQFRVIVIDSKPLFEGKHLARALATAGLEVQYSLMHAVSHAIKDATKVFLGAHAMMSNGRLYSRVGTAIVAMTANEFDVPVIVCCESVKFTEKVALDSIVSNEVAPPDELISPLPLTHTATTTTTTTATATPDQTGAATAGEAQGVKGSPLSTWRETDNLLLLNIMYDVTPAEYIKMVITEYGSLPPSSVPVVHRLSTNS